MLRFLEKLIFPIAFVMFALALVYWYWTTTPTYALNQVVWSVQNRDIKTFQKYVDLDSISSHAFDDIINGPARARIMGNYDSMIGVGIITFFKPEIISLVRDEVCGFIAAGSISKLIGKAKLNIENKPAEPPSSDLSPTEQALQQSLLTDPPATDGGPTPVTVPSDPTATTAAPEGEQAESQNTDGSDDLLGSMKHGRKVKTRLKDYGLSMEGFKGIDYLRIDGPNAYLGLKFHSPKMNKDWVIEFRLEEVGGYWRVEELSNLRQLVNDYLQTEGMSEDS